MYLIIRNSLQYSNHLLVRTKALENRSVYTLHWRHNDHDGVSNHQPHGCLLNRLFRRRSKKTSKLRVNGFCVGKSPGPVNSPHKGPVTRKMFPFYDVIIIHPWPLMEGRLHFVPISSSNYVDSRDFCHEPSISAYKAFTKKRAWFSPLFLLLLSFRKLGAKLPIFHRPLRKSGNNWPLE